MTAPVAVPECLPRGGHGTFPRSLILRCFIRRPVAASALTAAFVGGLWLYRRSRALSDPRLLSPDQVDLIVLAVAALEQYLTSRDR